MNERTSPAEYQPANPEKMDIKGLNFEDLTRLSEEVTALAKTSFRQTETGFANVNGDGIYILERNGSYRIGSISDRLPDFHRLVLHGQLNKSWPDREKLMQALQEMIEGLGNRIIE